MIALETSIPGAIRTGGVPVKVNLRGGEYVMGETAGDKFANGTERPAHRVSIATGFGIGKFPVTVGEFQCFRPEHGSGEANDWPVVRVSWQDATAYCDWLSRQTGQDWRLPSEAEWEFACRAGSTTPFSSGEQLSVREANFLHDENGMRVGFAGRMSVGSFPPNAFGICDLHGNVCEWVEDAWHPNYDGAPANGNPWRTPGEQRRVIRGGAWDYLPRLLRSSWRDWRPADYRADNVGFRIATSNPLR